MSYWAPLPDAESAALFAAQRAAAAAERGEVELPPPEIAPEKLERMQAAAGMRERLEELYAPGSKPAWWNLAEQFRRSQRKAFARLPYVQWNFLNHYDENRAAELSFTEARIMRVLMHYAGDDQVEVLLRRRAQRRRGDEIPTYHSELSRTLPTMMLISVVNFQNLFPVTTPILKVLALGSALLTYWGAAVLNRRASLQRVKLVEERLPGSDVIEQVVEGGAELEIIREHTPVMLRWLVLGAPSTKLEHRLGLLISNLDWFMLPPASWFRWQWFVAPALLLGYGLALAASSADLFGHNTVLLNVWTAVVSGALVGVGSVMNSNAGPRRLFAALLLAKLDARVEARIAEEAATERQGVLPSVGRLVQLTAADHSQAGQSNPEQAQ